MEQREREREIFVRSSLWYHCNESYAVDAKLLGNNFIKNVEMVETMYLFYT